MSDIQEIDEIIPSRSEASGTAAYLGGAPSHYAPPAAATPSGSDFPVSSPADSTPRSASKTPRKGLLGVLATIGAMLLKWWGVALGFILKFKGLLLAFKVLTIGKLFLTGGTMILSMFLWSFVYGWPLAVGIVLSLFVHESGHALAARQLGHKLGIMLFIPFCGAVVTSRGGRNVVEGAYVGIMGPVAGTLSGIVCVGLFFFTGNSFWLALASFIFFINLINLAPTAPLDGGWIAPLFSPKLLVPGLAFLLLFFWRNPLVWVLALMSLPRIIHAWKHGHESDYYKVTSKDRWTYGLSYLSLAAFLVFSQMACMEYVYSRPPHHTVRVSGHKA